MMGQVPHLNVPKAFFPSQATAIGLLLPFFTGFGGVVTDRAIVETIKAFTRVSSASYLQTLLDMH